MRRTLTRHPASPCATVAGVEVEALRPRPDLLALRYRLTGVAGGLLLPPPAAPARTDGLWRHTCLEAFVQGPGEGAYYEFNFAPSGQWAAYRFVAYRQGMAPAEAVPRIDLTTTDEGIELRAWLELGAAPGLPAAGPWRLGLSAVIEEEGGRISYWALAHPPGRPDFHAADCFALELPATEVP